MGNTIHESSRLAFGGHCVCSIRLLVAVVVVKSSWVAVEARLRNLMVGDGP